MTLTMTTPVIRRATLRRSRRRQGRRWTWLCVGLLLLLFAVPLRGLLRAEGAPMEEGVLLVLPELVLRGEVPNVDFLHPHGPGGLWSLAGVFEVFGVSLVAERLVALVQLVALVLGVFAVARRWGRTTALLGAVVTAVVALSPLGLVAVAWVGAVALGLWAVRCGVESLDRAPDSRAARRLAWAAGLLAGLALLYQPDLVLAVGLALAALAPALGPARRRPVIGGLVLALVPYGVHVAMAGAGPAWRGMVVDPLVNLRDGRHLPIPPSEAHLGGFRQRLAERDVLDWPAPIDAPQQLRAWFFVLLATLVVLMVAGVWAVARQPSTASRALLALALFCAGLLPHALQRVDSTGLAEASAVPLGLLPVALCTLWGRSHRGSAVQGAVAGALVVAVVLTAFPFFTARRYADYTLQTFGRGRSAHEIASGDRVFYSEREDVARHLNQLVADVDALAGEGDRLFVGPRDLRFTPYVDSFLYFLLPRLDPATPFIQMDPGLANAPGSGLADDVGSADVVVLGSVWDGWVEPNRSTQPGSDEPNRVLADRFCLERDYGGGLYGLYLRCR